MAADTVMGPVHPGEILLEEFLKPLAVGQYQLAKEIGVPARRINEIVHGQRRISADTALRLARFFGTSERFWIKPAVPLRPGGRKGPARRCARRHPPAHSRQLTYSPEASVPGCPVITERLGSGHRHCLSLVLHGS
jgi:antitoxin HigA-1